MRAAAPLLVLALLVSGCTAKTTTKEGAIELQSQGFEELRIELAKGQTMSWHWDTTDDVPVHFDFHTHEGGGVQHIEEKTTPTGDGTFAATTAGSYYLFWQNDTNSTTTMSYHVVTNGKVTGEYS
jgi:hypothetical protein